MPTPATLLPGQRYALVLSRFDTIDGFFVAVGQPDPNFGGELYDASAYLEYRQLATYDALYRTFVSP